MQQRPSILSLFGQMWLQNFRLQPVRTVLGSILSTGILVALVFFSFFFFAVFIVISVVGLVYWKFFGTKTEWTVSAQYPGSKSPRGTPQGEILEGEFRELKQVKTGSSGDPED